MSTNLGEQQTTMNRTALRKLAVAAAGIGAAAIIAAPRAFADTAIIVDGATPCTCDVNYAANYYDSKAVTKYVVVDYPHGFPAGPGDLTVDQRVAVGQQNLDAAIRQAMINDPNGKITVIGLSEGSMVVDAELAKLANDPNAPSSKHLSFIEISPLDRGVFAQYPPGTYVGTSVLAIGGFGGYGYTVPPTPVTNYNLAVITGQYDGWADPPQNGLNILADLNAYLGAQSVHGDVAFSNPADVPAQDITVTTNDAGGTTTSYFVPTAQLPLTQPLRAYLPGFLVDGIDSALRPIIDSAYNRADKQAGWFPIPGWPLVPILPPGTPTIPTPSGQMSVQNMLNDPVSALPKIEAPKTNPVAAVTPKVLPAVETPKLEPFKLPAEKLNASAVGSSKLNDAKINAVPKLFDLPKIDPPKVNVPKVDPPKVNDVLKLAPAGKN
jgi:hypothetical protein